jgi:hypothetical protein
MTMATSDNANYGFSYGALRSSGGLGDLIWRNHYNSAAGTELLRLTYNGKVGIGTNNPDSKLHIDGNFDGPLVTIHNTGGATSAYAGLEVETSTTGTTVQRWLNAGTELMRVVGNGNVGIGTNNPSTKLEVAGSIYSNNEGGSGGSGYGTGAELRVTNLSVSGSAVHYIEIGGNLPGYTAGQYNCLKTDMGDLHFAAGGVYTGAISYNSGFIDISDEREKENIVTISNATAKLKQLRGVYHTWKDTANRGTDTQIGLIAQEVEAVVPEVVTTSNPTSLNTPESDIAGLKGVAYSKLVPLLIETIKELEARITTLENA